MAHALVFGASGISGWALLNQLRCYPSPTTFDKITGLSNRPLTLAQAQLPDDERYQLVSGIDLTKSVDEVVGSLREKVRGVEGVTHVFFTAYIQTPDFESLKRVNTELLRVAVSAIEQVAPGLKTVILQTGGKGYGLEFPDQLNLRPPFRESHPRIPEPHASKIFYYTQYDLLTSLSAGKSWTFTEIRPDGIVGFAPTSNAMNMAQGIALYLSIYRELNGAGARVPFPGSPKGYTSTHSDTFQDILAKMEIWASTHTEACGNGAVFNAADGETVTWAAVWPRLAAHFGLQGTEPAASPEAPMERFVHENKATWNRLVERFGLRGEVLDQQNWAHVHFMLVQFDFNREYDLSRCREVGFLEKVNTVEGYVVAWERMRRAGILPPVEE